MSEGVDTSREVEEKATQDVQDDPRTREELMADEAKQAKVLLANDGLFLEEEEILDLMKGVDEECEAIVAAIKPWVTYIGEGATMDKILSTPAIDMQECVQRVAELKQIQQHLLITAAWMMKLKMQVTATPKIVTPNAGDGKIIGLDGQPVT